MRGVVWWLVALVACGGDRAEGILALEGDATAGEAVYVAECASCHGEDGGGGSGPAVNTESEASEIVEVVLEGEEEMPAFPDLSDQAIADLTAYVIEVL